MGLDYNIVDQAGDTVLQVRHLWHSEPPECCMCGKPVLELSVMAVPYYEGPCRSGHSEGGYKPACRPCYTRWAAWDDAQAAAIKQAEGEGAMTDRELLELAAKAAGMKPGTWFDGWNDEGRETGDYWNPLTDDGDALRLAVKCAQLFGFYRFLRAWLIAMATENGSPADPCAATRRAIVRAAAEIGRSMK